MATTPTVPKPLPMFGAYNEHWLNHPAGLPVSKYKPNTNPNTGAASVDAAWKAYQDYQQAHPTTPSTPATTPWNGWSTDIRPGQQAAPGTTSPATSSSGNPSPTAGGGTPGNFSSQYTPAMLNQVYENPWYILPDVFNGIQNTSPLYQSLRDMGADPLTMFNILQGSQGKLAGGAGEFTNWLADMFKNQGKVGGSPFDAKQLMGAIFGQDKVGADSSNTLGQILGSGDMSTQIRTLYNLARDASNVSLNPLAARAYQSSLAQAGDRYGKDMLGASGSESMSPSQWLSQNMPWLTLGG